MKTRTTLLTTLFILFTVLGAMRDNHIVLAQADTETADTSTPLPIPDDWNVYRDPYWMFEVAYPSDWTVQPMPYVDFGFRINSPLLEVDGMGRPLKGGYLSTNLVSISSVEWRVFQEQILSDEASSSRSSDDSVRRSWVTTDGNLVEDYYQHYADHLYHFSFVMADDDAGLHAPGNKMLDNIIIIDQPRDYPAPDYQSLGVDLSAFSFIRIKHAFPAGSGRVTSGGGYNYGHSGYDMYALDICQDGNCVRQGRKALAPTNMRYIDTWKSFEEHYDYHIFEVASSGGSRLCMSLGHFYPNVGWQKGVTSFNRGDELGNLSEESPPHIHMGLYTSTSSACNLSSGRVAVAYTDDDGNDYKLDGVEYPKCVSGDCRNVHANTWVTSTNGSGGETCPDPSADQITLHVDADYHGQCVTKGIGQYANPSAIGLPNDSISSIKVGSNVKAQLCQHDNYGAACEWFLGNDSNLSDNDLGNDSVSSIKVESRGGEDQCHRDSNNLVELYNHTDCGGTWAYGWQSPGLKPSFDNYVNDASSIWIKAGYSARVYDQQGGAGGSKCYNSSDMNFSGDTFDNGSSVNDRVRSIEIYAQENCPAPSSGDWSADYYDTTDRWWDDNNKNNHKCSKSYDGLALDRSYGTSAPCGGMDGDTWVGNYEAEIDFPSGTYVFYIEHDDGAKFWLNGQNKHEHGDYAPNSEKICNGQTGFALNGKEKLRVLLREDGGNARVKLWWDTNTSVCAPQIPDVPNLVYPGKGVIFDEGKNITLIWHSAANATEYEAEYWGGPAGTIKTTQSGTSWGIGSQWAGYKYFWRVRSQNSAGPSNWSPTLNFTVRPGAPTNLTGNAPSCGEISLNWDDNSGNEEGHKIYRNGSYLGSVGANETSYQDSSVAGGNSYSYFVRAYRGSIESDSSNTIDVDLPPCGPDLAPFAPSGYPYPVVPSSVKGTQEVNTLYAGKLTYFDWHFKNIGDATANGVFYVDLWIDDQRYVHYGTPDFSPGQPGGFDDWGIDGITPGSHTIKIVVDPEDTVVESDEDNNIWEQVFVWEEIPAWMSWEEYYNNTTLSGDPVWVNLGHLPARHYWGYGSPGPGVESDNFSARFTGNEYFYGGPYEFTIEHDEGARLWIDDVLVFDRWEDGGATDTFEYTPPEGDLDVVYETYELTGAARAVVDWDVVPLCEDNNEPNDSTSNATPIGYGGSADGDMCPVVDEDYFRFDGENGQMIVVDIDAYSIGSLMEPELTLFAPDGTTMLAGGWDDCGLGDQTIEYTLPEDGTYYLKVDECSDYSDHRYFYTLTLTSPADDVTLNPTADSHTTSLYKDRNQGTATQLRVKNAQTDLKSYLKFDIPDRSDVQIESATLRLFVQDNSKDLGTVFSTGNGWTELGLTWNNAPATGSVLDGSATKNGKWAEFDVKNGVSVGGTTSFVIESGSSDLVKYSSGEGTNPPELVITYQSTKPVPPTADFYADPTRIIEGETVQFNDVSDGNPTSWTWDFGDGGTSNEQNPSHEYNIEGNYTVSLTVTNTEDSDTKTVQDYITVDPEPEGETIFTSSSSNGIVGGIRFKDEDILAYDTANDKWAIHVDGSDIGLGASSAQDIDAFYILEDGSILMSFAGATRIPDVGKVDDSDVVRFVPTSLGANTAGSFEMYFDASDVALTTNGEDIVAVSVLSGGDLLLSTTGGWRVGSLRGGDEDLLRFTPTSLGWDTAGTWSLHFDGSDVGLSNTAYEDVWGVWHDVDSGDIYLTTLNKFSVSGAKGDGADILRCTPGSLGSNTSCTFELYWDGSAFGFAGERMDGLHITN